MPRQEKYPDTSYFNYYNHNPHNRKCDDCVFRAIGDAMDMPWAYAVRILTKIGLINGYPAGDKNTYVSFFKMTEIEKCKQPRKADNTKYSGKEWLTYLNDNYINLYKDVYAIVAHIGTHHIVCIKPIEDTRNQMNFVVRDIWDSTNGAIGNYFVITNKDIERMRANICEQIGLNSSNKMTKLL